MSRIGKLPVVIPAGVTVTVSPDNLVTVKGFLSVRAVLKTDNHGRLYSLFLNFDAVDITLGKQYVGDGLLHLG